MYLNLAPKRLIANTSTSNYPIKLLFILAGLLFLSLGASAASELPQIKPAPQKLPNSKTSLTCSKLYSHFKSEMGDSLKSETWIETTADDGKPLFIDLGHREKNLFLTFFKTNEGVWAEGNAEICPEEQSWIAKITKNDITVGSIAPWPIKLGFSGGAKFKLKLLEAKKLKISTFGWSGEFIPATKDQLAKEIINITK